LIPREPLAISSRLYHRICYIRWTSRATQRNAYYPTMLSIWAK